MDGVRFDSITRQLRGRRSRRSALLLALAITMGAAGPGRAIPHDVETPRRRSACQVRCGGERRMCRAECRRLGSVARECKRACTIVRDHCFLRCSFHPLRDRKANG